jgi:hypothetical protein
MDVAEKVDDHLVITRARDSFWAAHGRGGSATVAGLFAEDGIVLGPGMPELRGRAAIHPGACSACHLERDPLSRNPEQQQKREHSGLAL